MTRYMQQEEKELIIKLHLEGKFTTEIAKRINRSQSSIERFLKKEGYELHKKGKLTEKDKTLIIEEYKKGKTCKDIYEEYFKEDFTSSAMIERIVRNSGVSKGRYIKPVVLNERYFETIDNEMKAYWLGMLLADGSVIKKSENSFVIKLELKNQDKYILEEFAKDIGTDLEVKDYKYEYKNRSTKHNAVIQVHSKKMAQDLSVYGIVPQKTYKQNKIPNIPKEYLNHFIRGYFDGDGGISLIKPKDQNIHRAKIMFCADETLANELKELLFEEVDIESVIINMKEYGHNIYNVRFGKNEYVYRFYDYIYNNATFYMERKKEKFEKFIQERM